MALEIERKFIVTGVPNDVVVDKEYHILQNYLAVGNEEVRIRARLEKGVFDYTLTFKSGGDLVRTEVCNVIERKTYYQLLGLIPEDSIEKTRQVFEYNGHTLELDTFENKIMQSTLSHKIVEIEFASVEDANNFVPPDWFGEEVTNDPRYKNKNIWKHINNIREV